MKTLPAQSKKMVAMTLSNQTAPVRGKWPEALQWDNIFIMEVASLPSKEGREIDHFTGFGDEYSSINQTLRPIGVY